MVWFSLGVFIGQNEELLLLSHLAKTYRIRDLKIEFQSSVYIFSGRCHVIYVSINIVTIHKKLRYQRTRLTCTIV